MDITNKVKILKAYKLQLDQLGYIVENNKIKDRSVYSSKLRSGLLSPQKQNSGDRSYQHNTLLKRFFSIGFDTNQTTTPIYKEMVLYIASNKLNSNPHNKPVVKVANKLTSLGYIKTTVLADQSVIVNDTFNGVIYHYYNKTLYSVKGKQSRKVRP